MKEFIFSKAADWRPEKMNSFTGLFQEIDNFLETPIFRSNSEWLLAKSAFQVFLFLLEHPSAANSKNFSTDESSTFDESSSAVGIDSSDTEINEMVKEGTKEKAQKTRRSTTKTTTEEMLAFQMEQFNYQNRIKNMRLCFVIHLNDKEKSKQKNDKKIEIFS